MLSLPRKGPRLPGPSTRHGALVVWRCLAAGAFFVRLGAAESTLVDELDHLFDGRLRDLDAGVQECVGLANRGVALLVLIALAATGNLVLALTAYTLAENTNRKVVVGGAAGDHGG